MEMNKEDRLDYDYFSDSDSVCFSVVVIVGIEKVDYAGSSPGLGRPGVFYGQSVCNCAPAGI